MAASIDPVRAQGSLEENVTYPSPPSHDQRAASICDSGHNSSTHRARLETALRASGLLTTGIPWSGDMQGLSGGQRQRVSFARAIYSGAELVGEIGNSLLLICEHVLTEFVWCAGVFG